MNIINFSNLKREERNKNNSTLQRSMPNTAVINHTYRRRQTHSYSDNTPKNVPQNISQNILQNTIKKISKREQITKNTVTNTLTNTKLDNIFITKSIINDINNLNSLLYPHVFNKSQQNIVKAKYNTISTNVKLNINNYNWGTEEEIQKLRDKYFSKNTFIICMAGRVSVDTYPKSLLEAIKLLRHYGHNVELLLLSKLEIKPSRLTKEQYIELTNYKWVKTLLVDTKDRINYFRMSDLLASTCRDYYNNICSSKKIEEYLLSYKPILCSRGKEHEKKLGTDYFGFYNCDTCNTVPPLRLTDDYNDVKYIYQYNSYFKKLDETITTKQDFSKEINDILIIIKFHIINSNNIVNDVGILNVYDWCNTGFRYNESLKQNNIKCDMIKLFPTPTFNYGKEHFAITNRKNQSYYGIMKIKDTPGYCFEFTDYKVIKLLETFIKKCKYIYFHAESLFKFSNINFYNKPIIIGASGHPLRRNPKQFCRIFNPIVDGTLLQCPDLLNLNTKNQNLVYYGVDHNSLKYIKPTQNKLIIGHFSSSPLTKGSDIINKCIEHITKKYPDRFENFFKNKINYDKKEQHETDWLSHLRRYQNCDIYIETCKPYLNSYSVYTEYNNTPYGEWGNTCLEAAASGCIVITNSLSKHYYLKEYNYNYPILVANSEKEIINHLETLNKMSNKEIHNLKQQFLEWVSKKHSLKATGERFINKFLQNSNYKNIHPSYYNFKQITLKMNNNSKYKSFCLLYLINKDNNIDFILDNCNKDDFLSKNIECIFSTIDLSYIIKLNLEDLIWKNVLDSENNLIETISSNNQPNKIHIKIKLKPFASNLLIYFKFKSQYNSSFDIVNNSIEHLHVRNINKDFNIKNKNNNSNIIKSNNIENLFLKPVFKVFYNNHTSSEEDKKINIIDKYINEYN